MEAPHILRSQIKLHSLPLQPRSFPIILRGSLSTPVPCSVSPPPLLLALPLALFYILALSLQTENKTLVLSFLLPI